MSDWSSFEDDKQIYDAWQKFLTEADIDESELEEGFGDWVKDRARRVKDTARRAGRGLARGAGDLRRRAAAAAAAATAPADADATDAAGAGAGAGDATPEPAAPTAAAATAAKDASMPISGTEFATMNIVTGGKLINLVRQAADLGAAAKAPEDRGLQQAFNKEFFTNFIKMTKNPNIDIAEGLDLDTFLEEILLEAYGEAEAGGPLSGRTQAAKKGQMRRKGGIGRYLKPMGRGKPPAIANKISRALTKSLMNVDAAALEAALPKVLATIKDPKEKATYQKQYTKLLSAQPQKRVQLYKQNVQSFIDSVTALASAAAAKAMQAAPGDFAADKASAKAKSRLPGAGGGGGGIEAGLAGIPSGLEEMIKEELLRVKK